MNIINENPVVVIITAVLLGMVVGAIGYQNLLSILHSKRQIIKNVRASLQLLRDQVPGHSARARHIIRAVDEGHVSFEELGTSREELLNLGNRLEHKQCAISLLDTLRRSRSDYTFPKFESCQEAVSHLQSYLDKAQITLADLECTQDELDSFPMKIAKDKALDAWNKASYLCENGRQCMIVSEKWHQSADYWLEAAGLKPDDIGIPSEKYDELVALRNGG